MSRAMKKALLAASLALVLAIFVMVWNEARKEVVFLCGNFQPGVTEASVLAQLDTGHFLRYRVEDLPGGHRIVADSLYNFSVYRCVVEIDGGGVVSAAEVQ